MSNLDRGRLAAHIREMRAANPANQWEKGWNAAMDAVLGSMGQTAVSGEDRSEPTPAPRPGDRVRLFTPDDVITGVLYVGQDGKQRVLEHDRWGHLVDVPGRHVEVVTPEGTP